MGAAAAFDTICRAFEARGRPRSPSATPTEHFHRLVAGDAVARAERTSLEMVVRTFERDRFAERPPEQGEVDAALAAADRIREAAEASR